jgi:hypothetical protein
MTVITSIVPAHVASIEGAREAVAGRNRDRSRAAATAMTAPTILSVPTSRPASRANHRKDRTGTGAERYPDSDFACSPVDGVGENAVQANRGQRHGKHTEDRGDIRHHSLA